MGYRLSVEYQAWRGTKSRCLNPSYPSYKNYGGRGITICDRWRDSFDAFLADVGRRPSSEYSLDRVDNNRGYEPGNVRWASRAEQARNRRDNRLLTLDGETRCLAEWSEIVGISQTRLGQRSDYGWSDERVLTTPLRVRGAAHCMRGHIFTAESTKVHPTTGYRQCRICERQLAAIRKERGSR